MTARDEINASAALWGWEAIPSSLHDETIYRRDDNLFVFVQFDRAGVVRRATRYVRDNRMLKAAGELSRGIPAVSSKVQGWLAADGERPMLRRVGAR